jgi:hypothetical protein
MSTFTDAHALNVVYCWKQLCHFLLLTNTEQLLPQKVRQERSNLAWRPVNGAVFSKGDIMRGLLHVLSLWSQLTSDKTSFTMIAAGLNQTHSSQRKSRTGSEVQNRFFCRNAKKFQRYIVCDHGIVQKGRFFRKWNSWYTVSWWIRKLSCIEEVPRFFFFIQFKIKFKNLNWLQLNLNWELIWGTWPVHF